jgi:hypothetical protein
MQTTSANFGSDERDELPNEERAAHRYIDALTDTQIYAAIRYLEPSSKSTKKQYARSADEQNDDGGVLICLGFMILLFGGLAFMLLYWRQ